MQGSIKCFELFRHTGFKIYMKIYPILQYKSIFSNSMFISSGSETKVVNYSVEMSNEIATTTRTMSSR